MKQRKLRPIWNILLNLFVISEGIMLTLIPCKCILDWLMYV